MQQKTTVVVVGAGAGCDFGMPLGMQLLEQIRQNCTFQETEGFRRYVWSDGEIQAALQSYNGTNMAGYGAAMRCIHQNIKSQASIDDFLDFYQSDQDVNLCGKLLIARAVLHSERESKLIRSPDNARTRLDLGLVNDSWLMKLWRVMQRGYRKENVADCFAPVLFINFNYDRCIEHFFFEMLRGMMSDAEAADIVRQRLRMLHPYGCIGSLPLDRTGGVPYGARHGVDLIQIAGGLRTYTETIAENDELAHIRTSLREADILVFMGLHFHKQNMALLKPMGNTKMESVYATALNISRAGCDVVKSEIDKIVMHEGVRTHNTEVHIHPELDCSRMLDFYEKVLLR